MPGVLRIVFAAGGQVARSLGATMKALWDTLRRREHKERPSALVIVDTYHADDE